MATLALDADDLSDCLPAVCIVTGAREGVRARAVRWRWVPPLAYVVLLLFGPGLVFLIIIASVWGRVASGVLPFTDDGYRRWRLGVWMQLGCFVLGILLLMAALAIRQATGLLFLLGIASILFSLVATRIWKGPRCVRIDAERLVTLDIPSEAAAEIIRQKLQGTPPRGAMCVNHGQTRAIGVCVRCGTFGCAACISRPREKAARRCAACRTMVSGSSVR